ncbi:hypothetical protein C7I87_01630 [Mesorhizobium sp. SARCC-RB16n]|uniref:hypothetical protein n=1 Tax=Mesorhizobium sp. SARCC-RB16n TaxID=2116687 RepID=UPI00122F77CC|nr:hypothetical protein [Mesorhizobium sp. SARCC-RB16n]KAA3452574.1 hypothetical protein C7I87_01630 [Mesorhizobium sp. SARCC-RB16n]
MDPATATVMVMLSCSASLCQAMESRPVVYSSMEECQAALEVRLAPWPNGEVVGRCKQVDRTATGSTPAEGYASVQVTRGIGGDAVTTSYFVPKANDQKPGSRSRRTTE